MSAIVPQKTCSKCKQSFPLTFEFWNRLAKSNDGFQPRCKNCTSQYNRERYLRQQGETIARNNAYYHANKEWILPRQKEYTFQHREHKSEVDKKWRLANKTRKRENAHRYHVENRERENARTRRWKKANPARVHALNSQRRARLLGAEGDGFTAEDRALQLRSQKGICWWCSKLMGNDVTDDHVIPLTKGGKHDPRNIVLCHSKCNCSKSDKLPQEWAGRLF